MKAKLLLTLACIFPVFAVATLAATNTIQVFDSGLSGDFGTAPSTHIDPVIQVGDTVEWVWDNGNTMQHSTTAAAGQQESWDSGLHTLSFTFAHTFTHTGTFNYYCTTHGFDAGGGNVVGMSGHVIVQAAPMVIYPPGDVNGTNGVTSADSLLINQVLVDLRSSNSPIFQVTGFLNGDVNQDGQVTGGDSLLINQQVVALRSFIVTKIVPNVHSNNVPTPVTIFGIGFPTNTVTGASIGPPVNLTLSNVVIISREELSALVPAGGGIGTGVVTVIATPDNGVISFGRFINQ